MANENPNVACVASVSVKQRAKNGVLGVLPARKMGREQKIEGGGGGGERRKRLRTNPLILKTSVRQRTELVIGWASQTLLTCVDQRSQSSECRKERSKLVYKKRFSHGTSIQS